MHVPISVLQQSDNLDTEVNRLLEWATSHPTLFKSAILLVFSVNILLILIAVAKRKWILEKIKEHDRVEKLFIISFFATVIGGISVFIVMYGILALQRAGEPLFMGFLVSGLLLLLFVLALLACTGTFLVLCVRLFILMKPAHPLIDDEVNWGGTPVLVVITAFFLVSFALGFLSGIASSVGGSVLFIVLPLFLILKPYDRTLDVMGFRKPIMRLFLISLPLIPVLIYGNAAIYEITEKIFGQFPLDEITADIIAENPIVMSIQLGIFGAIAEEVFFRGFAYTALKRKYGFKKGIIFSSLFFGMYHLIPWQIPYAVVAGIILAYVYEKTQSIYVPITFHVINNLVAVIELWA